MAGTAGAQTIIPVDGKFPPLEGLRFQGSWKYGDPAGGGMLKVGKASNRNGWHSRSLASTWTEIKETVHGRPDGRELTLTSVETQPMQRHRPVYKIDGRYQFTVIFAAWESATWVTPPAPHAASFSER